MCPQEAERYIKRHQQELDLLRVGSENLGTEYTEGVSVSQLKADDHLQGNWAFPVLADAIKVTAQ